MKPERRERCHGRGDGRWRNPQCVVDAISVDGRWRRFCVFGPMQAIHPLAMPRRASKFNAGPACRAGRPSRRPPARHGVRLAAIATIAAWTALPPSGRARGSVWMVRQWPRPQCVGMGSGLRFPSSPSPTPPFKPRSAPRASNPAAPGWVAAKNRCAAATAPAPKPLS